MVLLHTLAAAGASAAAQEPRAIVPGPGGRRRASQSGSRRDSPSSLLCCRLNAWRYTGIVARTVHRTEGDTQRGARRRVNASTRLSLLATLPSPLLVVVVFQTLRVDRSSVWIVDCIAFPSGTTMTTMKAKLVGSVFSTKRRLYSEESDQGDGREREREREKPRSSETRETKELRKRPGEDGSR